jgi:hypothetical protein
MDPERATTSSSARTLPGSSSPPPLLSSQPISPPLFSDSSAAPSPLSTVLTLLHSYSGLGKSSLKPEDAVADYSTLNESELKVLDDWEKYFQKRYNVVGVVQE